MSEKITIEVDDAIYAWLKKRQDDAFNPGGYDEDPGPVTIQQFAAQVLTESIVNSYPTDECDIEVGYHEGSCFYCQHHRVREQAVVSVGNYEEV